VKTADSGSTATVVIAIDGPAGAGKTTTAREVARRLGFKYLDTGAMYRTIALHVLRQGCDLSNPDEIARIAEDADISIEFIDGTQKTCLKGEDVSELIRSPEVSKVVSPVSEVPAVRRRMVALQRENGKSGQNVVEGRDIGTVVFPDAVLKVFMTADIEERARRRLSDFSRSGIDSDIQKIAADIEERDGRDSNREDSPLSRADDAVLIDTTSLSFEDQVEKIIQNFREKTS